ncbi:MAG: hypothetical protein WC456_00550 [Patescibacteria group bacterium]
MQTNRRNLGLLVIIIGLIILALVVYFTFFRSEEAPSETPAGETVTATPQLETSPLIGTTTPSDRPVNRQTYDLSKEAPHQFNINDLTKIAESFAARFGSFSSQSDYNNFTDLRMFMTESLRDWVDGYVQKLKAERSSATYYGITTKALVSDVKSFDDQAGSAEVFVTTERSESTEQIGGGTPYRQDLRLKFKKVNGDWLVDEVYWQK